MNSIEKLSNEIFYDIFDYLDACNLFQSFSNLNSRFQQLINSSHLKLKIKSDEKYKKTFHHYFQEIFNNHKQQISLIDLSNFTSDFYTSYFHQFSSLPFLSSLTICVFGTFNQFIELNQLIFNLRNLKSYVFSLLDSDVRISLPMATNSQSPIEYLIFDQSCTFYELAMILSYIPRIQQVRFINEINEIDADRYFPSMKLIHLTSLSLQMYEAEYPLFERFIKKIEANLKKLFVTTQSYDMRYLHANRWEQLITELFPQLDKFSLKYCEYIDQEEDFDDIPEEIKGFFTSFWIDRRWLFDAEIEDEYIYYYIRSHGKRWYNDEIIDPSKSTRLEVDYSFHYDWKSYLEQSLERILSISRIYHLQFSGQITYEFLFEILQQLPDLQSLKIFRIASDQKPDFNIEENPALLSMILHNKISKLYLMEIDYPELSYITFLCPSMKSLRLDFIDGNNLQILVQFTLTDPNQFRKDFHSLSFRVHGLDDHLMNITEKLLESQKILTDFCLKRVADRVFLSWK